MLLAQPLAHGVPEISVDGQTAFGFLRRTRHIDHGGQELVLLVPEEQHVQAVILIALNAAEVLGVGGAVHLGGPIRVHSASIVGHDGLAQPPADLSRLALLPRLDDCVGDLRRHELRVFRGLHIAFLGQRVTPFERDRRVVRVRGVHEQLAHIEVRQTRLHLLAHRFQDAVTDAHQVARHHDRLIEHLVSVARLPGQGRGSHR